MCKRGINDDSVFKTLKSLLVIMETDTDHHCEYEFHRFCLNSFTIDVCNSVTKKFYDMTTDKYMVILLLHFLVTYGKCLFLEGRLNSEKVSAVLIV